MNALKNILKKITAGAALCLAAVALTAAPAHAAVQTGGAAPNFTLTDTGGTSHNLTDFKGSYVVLEWTNDDCPFVKKFYQGGDMQALQAKWTSEGVVWLRINSSAPGKQGHVSGASAQASFNEKSPNATALLLDADGKVGKIYAAKTTPHMYVISPEGTLIYQGAIDSKRSANPADIASATNYVNAALTQAMAGEAIAQPTTKAYGCSVKY